MSRLVAYFGNEPENVACALFSARDALYARGNGRIEGWALGFVQGGDVLLQKRPRADAADVDFFALARDLKADALIGRVGLGRDGNKAAEDADPFRFRSWLFASIGAVPSFERLRDRLLESIPDFLRRNIRGRSPSELLFHLFLANLHEGGILEQPSPAPAQVKAALQGMLAFVGGLLETTLQADQAADGGPADHGHGLELALVTTNGRCLVAAGSTHPLQFLRIDGISDCPVCQGKTHLNGNGRRISHDALRAVIIEADTSSQVRPGWRAVAEGTALVIGADHQPHLVALA